MHKLLPCALSFIGVVVVACSSGNAQTPDGGTLYTSAPPDDVSCNTDSDCCVAIDTCHSIAYVVHAGDALQIPQTSCNYCLAPPVQVWCESGKCRNAVLPLDPSTESLAQNHCGSITLPGDAGTPATSDAGAHGCS